MAMLILQNGKGYKVPECEKCKSRLVPLNYQDLKGGIWKCLICKRSQQVEKESK